MRVQYYVWYRPIPNVYIWWSYSVSSFPLFSPLTFFSIIVLFLYSRWWILYNMWYFSVFDSMYPDSECTTKPMSYSWYPAGSCFLLDPASNATYAMAFCNGRIVYWSAKMKYPCWLTFFVLFFFSPSKQRPIKHFYRRSMPNAWWTAVSVRVG